MFAENGLEIDARAMETLLTQGELVTIGFTLFPDRLLIDVRTSATEDQWVGLVDPAPNIQERYLWLGRHRGSFGSPEAFSFFIWPETVRGLIDRDLLRALRHRLSPEACNALDTALNQALELERQAIIDAVRGTEAWPAIWQA
mgnify:CR=1 FL=1